MRRAESFALQAARQATLPRGQNLCACGSVMPVGGKCPQRWQFWRRHGELVDLMAYLTESIRLATARAHDAALFNGDYEVVDDSMPQRDG